MAENRRWVRMSTPAGHFTVSRAVAAKAGSAWRELKADAVDSRGRPLPPKLREDIDEPSPSREKAAKKAAASRTPKLRVDSDAATPTPAAESPSGDNEEKS